MPQGSKIRGLKRSRKAQAHTHTTQAEEETICRICHLAVEKKDQSFRPCQCQAPTHPSPPHFSSLIQ